MKVFSLYDEKAECFNQPFFQKTIGEAIRSMSNLISDPNTVPGKYPQDFTLFQVGEFNEQNGEMVPDKKSIGSLVEFKKGGE